MKTIYICSPLRGDIETNIARAKQYCRAVSLEGNLPIAPPDKWRQPVSDDKATIRRHERFNKVFNETRKEENSEQYA